ncbi:MAG: ABC transporter ATP-binding protein, partial [Nitrososphaeraceae archaeon]
MLSKGESESFQQKIILQIKNLSKVYYRNADISSIANADDEYFVLNNLSMDIKDGEFVTIVGPSGCGKSTLLNIIAGIDREYSGGEILFNGLQSDHITSTTHINQDKIIIFQEAALFPWLTVLENVEFGLRVAKVSKDKRNKIAMYYIEMVQLSNFANAYVHQLSGGMKQRVAIARALALNPKILLMDEPFASLDVHTRQMLRLQLLQIHQTTKKTVLFVTHEIKEAVALG